MEERTREMLGTALEQGDTTDMDGKYLTFITDHQLFGVPISDVVQIVGMQNITIVPDFPAYAKGIINLRGSIIPVIDVRLRFGKEERAYDERTCIIVTLIGNVSVGFIVDEVDAVTDIDGENVSPPPKISGETTDTYLTGIAKLENKIVLLLSAAKLLTQDAIITLTETEHLGGKNDA